MSQLFHKSLNPLGRVAIFGSLFGVAGGGLFLTIFFRSDYATGAHTAYVQPVPFSHLHHVGQLGIDCRYCHTSVEVSPFAGLPPTKTCMNCHQQMWVGSEMLGPVRESYKTDRSLPWQRVHNLPGFVYFNHSIHVSKGVGCVTCHGQLDSMPLTWQVNTLLMEWCLQCHRNPEPNLRPQSEVTSMTWYAADPDPNHKSIDPDTGEAFPTDQGELGKLLRKKYNVRNTEVLTSCSTCHR